MKVKFNGDTCSSAGECVKGSPAVFQVIDGQFVIKQDAAPEAEIRATVAKCPTGALTIEE